MTLFEAIKAIQEGKRVKHPMFFKSNKEWIKQSDKDGYYEYNDGTIISGVEFWSMRKSIYTWTFNWEVVE